MDALPETVSPILTSTLYDRFMLAFGHTRVRQLLFSFLLLCQHSHNAKQLHFVLSNSHIHTLFLEARPGGCGSESAAAHRGTGRALSWTDRTQAHSHCAAVATAATVSVCAARPQAPLAAWCRQSPAGLLLMTASYSPATAHGQASGEPPHCAAVATPHGGAGQALISTRPAAALVQSLGCQHWSPLPCAFWRPRGPTCCWRRPAGRTHTPGQGSRPMQSTAMRSFCCATT